MEEYENEYDIIDTKIKISTSANIHKKGIFLFPQKIETLSFTLNNLIKFQLPFHVNPIYPEQALRCVQYIQQT